MRNFELFALEGTLQTLTKERLSATAAYKLLRALKDVTKETAIIREAIPGFIAFEQKRMAPDADVASLAQEHATDIQQANELLGNEFSGDIRKINLTDLRTPDGHELALTMAQAAALEPIINQEA